MTAEIATWLVIWVIVGFALWGLIVWLRGQKPCHHKNRTGPYWDGGNMLDRCLDCGRIFAVGGMVQGGVFNVFPPMPDDQIEGMRRFIRSKDIEIRKITAGHDHPWVMSREIAERIAKRDLEVTSKKQAGRVDVNGNITGNDGSAITYGIVCIPSDEAEKAKAAGWEIISSEQFGGPIEDKCFAMRDYDVRPLGKHPNLAAPYLISNPGDPAEKRGGRSGYSGFTDPRSNIAEGLARWDVINNPEAGEPVEQPPMPNVGGEGHPDYQGPNYTDASEIADELKGLRHYGKQDDE